MLFCGVDIGTTNLKVALTDGTGRSVWLRSFPTPRSAVDRSSVDGQIIVRLIEGLIIEGWTAVGDGRPLAAICTTGVGEDGVFVGEAFQLLSPIIPWFDRSAAPQAERIRTSPAETPRAGIEMEPTRTGARWLWFREHHPQIAARARYWIALTDLPAAIWAGRPFISETLAARTGCYDVVDRAWLPALLAACGAPPLPPVLRAAEVVGPVVAPTLLSSGAADGKTLVVAGGHDHPVAASFIQRIDPTARVDSIGTANVVYGETPQTALDRFDPDIAFMVPVRAAKGLACLGVFEFSAAVQALESRGVDIRAFLALPHMPGEPTDGLSGTEPRAVFEMAGLAARRMMERMAAAGVPDGPVFATGGWSRSTSLLELRASIYGRRVHALAEQEPAVVGAALLGAEGAGAAVDLNNEARAGRPVEPDDRWARFYDDCHRAQSCRSGPMNSMGG
jgi:xylulokinase